MIADNCTNKDVRNEMEKAFLDAVRKDQAGKWPDGLGLHVFDELYFGNSKNSLGLQIADMCMYIVARNLAKKPDVEGFYSIIKEQVFNPKQFPGEQKP
jgi:hypothetical protein